MRVASLVDRVEEEFVRRARQWESMREVVLVPELQAILTRAVCAWAGLSLSDAELEQRTRELAAMYERAGTVGPRNWRGQLLRRRTERWLRAIVAGVRMGTIAVPESCPVHVIALHVDHNGRLLDGEHAAVEIINLLRPT